MEYPTVLSFRDHVDISLSSEKSKEARKVERYLSIQR